MRIDPSKTWRTISKRLDHERDPRLRSHLQILLKHMKAEAIPDGEALMETLGPKPSYHA